MAYVRIEWLTDDHECETCGTSWAEGARVFIDGALALDLKPAAHCYDGASWDQAEVYRLTLDKLGHVLIEEAE